MSQNNNLGCPEAEEGMEVGAGRFPGRDDVGQGREEDEHPKGGMQRLGSGRAGCLHSWT